MMHHPSAVAIIRSHQQFNMPLGGVGGRAGRGHRARGARSRKGERERQPHEAGLVWPVLCICMYRAAPALARQCQSVSNPREVKRGPSNEIDRAAKITSGLGLCLWQANIWHLSKYTKRQQSITLFFWFGCPGNQSKPTLGDEPRRGKKK